MLRVACWLLHLPRIQAPQALLEFYRVLRPGGTLYVGVKEGEGKKWVTDQKGQERFFTYYQPEEIDRLIQAGNFEIVGRRLFRRLRQETHPSGP